MHARFGDACAESTEAVVTTPPPPPPPLPPLLGPGPVLPSPIGNERVATTCSGSANVVHASEAYVVENVRWHGLIIEKYTPVGAADSFEAMLYLPSASCERPSVPSHWQRNVIVYALRCENTGAKPWRNDIPPKLREWVVEAQLENPRIQWSLYGGSRGGAWAAILAADASLVWSRVLLVAPYVLPCRDAQPPAGGLQRLGERLHVVCGEADFWLPATRRFVQDCAIGGTCVIQVFSGLAHEASLREGEVLWKRLFSTL